MKRALKDEAKKCENKKSIKQRGYIAGLSANSHQNIPAHTQKQHVEGREVTRLQLVSKETVKSNNLSYYSEYVENQAKTTI